MGQSKWKAEGSDESMKQRNAQSSILRTNARSKAHLAASITKGHSTRKSKQKKQQKGRVAKRGGLTEHDIQVCKRAVGHGQQGAVHLCRRCGESEYSLVVKRVKLHGSRSQAELDRLYEEEKALRACSAGSGYIVDIEGVFVDSHGYLSLVMERCAGGSLQQLITAYQKRGAPAGSLPERWIASVTKQLLLALEHVHCHNVLHRDIKPANILFRSAECDAVKLADFGVAKVSHMSLAETRVGSPLYSAPELLLQSGAYDSTCDLWSLGACIVELATMEKCFRADSLAGLIGRLARCDYRTPVEYSKAFQTICSQLLTPAPSERLSAATLLRTSYMKGTSFNSLPKPPSSISARPKSASRGGYDVAAMQYEQERRLVAQQRLAARELHVRLSRQQTRDLDPKTQAKRSKAKEQQEVKKQQQREAERREAELEVLQQFGLTSEAANDAIEAARCAFKTRDKLDRTQGGSHAFYIPLSSPLGNDEHDLKSRDASCSSSICESRTKTEDEYIGRCCDEVINEIIQSMTSNEHAVSRFNACDDDTQYSEQCCDDALDSILSSLSDEYFPSPGHTGAPMNDATKVSSQGEESELQALYCNGAEAYEHETASDHAQVSSEENTGSDDDESNTSITTDTLEDENIENVSNRNEEMLGEKHNGGAMSCRVDIASSHVDQTNGDVECEDDPSLCLIE